VSGFYHFAGAMRSSGFEVGCDWLAGLDEHGAAA
jgi:hypothetical protein